MNKIIIVEFDDHIVCRNNGEGPIFSEGVHGGLAKYFFDDDNMEAVHTV